MPFVKVNVAPRKVESVDVTFTPAEMDLITKLYYLTGGLAINSAAVLDQLVLLRTMFKPVVLTYTAAPEVDYKL